MQRMSVRGSRFVQLTLLLIAVLLATYPVLRNHFINWDDRDQITLNPDFNPPTLGRQLAYWRGPYVGSLYPVSYNFLAVLAWMADDPPPAVNEPLDPRVFHAASVVLHAAATLLVWLILRRLVAGDWPATVGAMVFGVHPVQVEAVAWVSGMNTLLFAALSLWAIWQYLLAIQTVRPTARAVLFASATVAYVLALWAKPAAVIVPVVAALLDWLLTRRDLRRIVPLLVVGILIALPVIVITRMLQTAELVTPTPLWMRPIVALDALAFYLAKLLIPARLLVDYGRTPQWLMDRPIAWLSGLVPVALTVVCWRRRRRAPWLWVAAAVFVVSLLPVLGLTPFNVQMISTVTDRYLYLAMLAPAMVVAYALERAAAAARGGSAGAAVARGRTISNAGYVIAAVVLLALTVRSNLRARDWHDEFSLFLPELKRNPRSLAAHQVLGVTYSRREQYDRAAYHLNEALKTKPDDPRSLYNLANILLVHGQFGQAAELYRAALMKFPSDARVHSNLGTALAQLGRLDEAEAAFRRALALQPAMPEATKGLEAVARTRAATGESPL